MEPLKQLTEEEKSRIKAEAIYRQEVQKELEAGAETKPKENKTWRFLNSSFGLWFLSTIVVGLITFFYTSHQKQQQEIAETARKVAKEKSDSLQNQIEDARRNATLITDLLPHLASDKKIEWTGATAVMKYLYKKGKLPDELQLALINFVQVDSGSHPDSKLSITEQKTNAVLSILDLPDSEVKNKIIPAVLPPRVYIQISDESQRKDAIAVQNKLKEEGFFAPGIENVGKNSPGSLQVRYYWDNDLPEAGKVLSIVHSPAFKLTNIYGQPVKINARIARQRHYEIYFPKI